MLPLFVIPIARNVIRICPKLERILLFGYWAATFGWILYGLLADSPERALQYLIFTWLLTTWIVGLPVLFFVSWIWNRGVVKAEVRER